MWGEMVSCGARWWAVRRDRVREGCVARWGCVWRDGTGWVGVDAFLPFSFPPLIAVCTFITISFVLQKFFWKYFPKFVLRNIISKILLRCFLWKLFEFRFTEGCYIKHVISRKNLPQKRFWIFLCMDRNSFIPCSRWNILSFFLYPHENRFELCCIVLLTFPAHICLRNNFSADFAMTDFDLKS